MSSFLIELAKKKILIHAIFDSSRDFCKDYLTTGIPDIIITISQEDIANEHLLAAKAEGIIYPAKRYPDEYIETLAIYRKIATEMTRNSVLLMHGSVIAKDGHAYLFTAPSGTGKTTHCRLWLDNIAGSYFLNGDKPLILLENNCAYACGTPWQGKENYGCNEILPLVAICFLQRGKENRIEEMTRREFFSHLMEPSFIPHDIVEFKSAISLLMDLKYAVKPYKVICNMEPEAAVIAYKKISVT